MSIYQSSTNRPVTKFPNLSAQELTVWKEEVPAGGMNTVLDSPDIPLNQFRMLKNCYVRDDKIISRFGTSLLTPTKPNTNEIRSIISFRDFNGNNYLYRVTAGSIHRRAGSWTVITPGVALDAASYRFRFATINNRLVFTNGIDEVQELDFAADTHADLGNAEVWKYITGWNERVCVAYKVDSGGTDNPIMVAGSGQLNFAEFDPTVDISAFEEPLLEEGESFSDPITGLFGFSTRLIVPKERSVWIGSKLPTAQKPVAFITANTGGIGGDIPDAIAQIPNGLVFYNYFHNNVFVYSLFSEGLTPIGDSIRDSIGPSIDNLELVFGTFIHRTQEYYLCIGHDYTPVVDVWVFNFRSKAWTYHCYNDLTALAQMIEAQPILTIGDLVGTIGSLVGTIGDLVSDSSLIGPRLAYGFSNGDISVEDPLMDTDTRTAGSETIEHDITSRTYDIATYVSSINRLVLVVTPKRAGSLIIAFSKDNGVTFTDYKRIEFDGGDVNKRHKIVCTKHIKCDYYTWKLYSDSATGPFEFLHYEIDSFEGGKAEATKSGSAV